jgi:hypothetical protein
MAAPIVHWWNHISGQREPTRGESVLIVAGHLYVDESSRRDYLTSCLEVMTPRQIGGRLSRFVLSADPIEADRINVYEIWETDEQLDAFRGADPSAGRAAWIHGVDVRRYRIAMRKPGRIRSSCTPT